MRFVLGAVLIALSFGCKAKDNAKNTKPKPGDLPAQVQTLVDKLGSKSKAEVGKALDALERLKNPAAIPALDATYRKSGDGQFLKAIIGIAHDKRKRTLHANALTLLLEVARAVRVNKPPSKVVDQAVHAIRALRDSKSPKALTVLVEVCRYPAKYSYAQRATIMACLALAHHPGDPAFKAALIALERGAKTKSPMLSAAAARTLSKLGDKRALGPLAKAMFVAPKAFPSVREAIVAMGPDAVPKMMAIFAGVDADINEMAVALKITRSHMQRQAALMLGDLYVKKAVPHLLKSLETPGAHHEAVFIALTQIADPSGIKTILKYAFDKKHKKPDRINAVGAYGVLSSNAKQLPRLLGWLRVEKDKVLRNILALSAAQLVRDQRSLTLLIAALPKKHKIRKAAIAVASVGALCGDDSACYLIQVESLPRDVHARVSKLKGVSLTAKQMARIKPLVDVRALTDVVKLRNKTRPPLTTLLRLLATGSVVVHRQLLYALVHTAPRPCPRCVVHLDMLLGRRGRADAQITQGLRMIHRYLRWAK